jgi:hypothetical protein
VESTCSGCQEIKATADMKDVGSHLFCTPCFANLMSPEPKTEPEPEPISFSFESALQGEPKSESERCFVCQQELPEDGQTKLGSIGVCQSCREGLTLPPPEPPAKKAPVVETEEVDPGPMYTPGSASYECSACQRGMPGPGSFHEVDGAYYCPDCFYSGKAQPQPSQPQSSVQTPSSAEPVPEFIGQTPGAGEKCDACMRPLVRHYFEILSGFSICRACTSSNQDLALTIARVRHKRHLEEIAQGLVTSQPH